VQIYGGVNTINDGNWHHLIHSFKRTADAITYLDGVQVDSRTCVSAGDLDTGNVINIGQDPTGGYAEDGSATIDDLAVWRTALTAYQAYAVHYAATNSNLSFDTVAPVSLQAAKSGTNVVLSWQPSGLLGTLYQADAISGPWTPVGVFVPYYEVPATGTQKFYKLR
jgi:hypothetical protein